MAGAEETFDRVAVALPAGSRAALERVAAENYTTAQALMSRYILDGLEQTKLARKFDMALGGVADSRED